LGIDLVRVQSSYTGTVSRNGLYLSVKIDFQRQGGSIENRAAIAAIAQMALDFTAYFGGQATFQVFAN